MSLAKKTLKDTLISSRSLYQTSTRPHCTPFAPPEGGTPPPTSREAFTNAEAPPATTYTTRQVLA